MNVNAMLLCDACLNVGLLVLAARCPAVPKPLLFCPENLHDLCLSCCHLMVHDDSIPLPCLIVDAGYVCHSCVMFENDEQHCCC